MPTKAEAIAASRVAQGFQEGTSEMLGHGERRFTGRSYYVHRIRWWRPVEKSPWGFACGIWLCGNMSAQAHLVTEVPDGMQMCHHCEKKATR